MNALVKRKFAAVLSLKNAARHINTLLADLRANIIFNYLQLPQTPIPVRNILRNRISYENELF